MHSKLKRAGQLNKIYLGVLWTCVTVFYPCFAAIATYLATIVFKCVAMVTYSESSVAVFKLDLKSSCSLSCLTPTRVFSAASFNWLLKSFCSVSYTTPSLVSVSELRKLALKSTCSTLCCTPSRVCPDFLSTPLKSCFSCCCLVSSFVLSPFRLLL